MDWSSSYEVVCLYLSFGRAPAVPHGLELIQTFNTPKAMMYCDIAGVEELRVSLALEERDPAVNRSLTAMLDQAGTSNDFIKEKQRAETDGASENRPRGDRI